MAFKVTLKTPNGEETIEVDGVSLHLVGVAECQPGWGLLIC
jgi:hypothetical protein